MSISLKLQNWNTILDFYLNEKCIYELYYDLLIFNPKFKRSWYTENGTLNVIQLN